MILSSLPRIPHIARLLNFPFLVLGGRFALSALQDPSLLASCQETSRSVRSATSLLALP